MNVEEENCQILENISFDDIEITTQEFDNILDIQQNILTMIATHKKSADILERLCTLAESLLPNSVASIMFLDNTTGLMNVLSAPSIPQVGKDALANLKPSEGGGSCANAVYKNEAQFVQDTFNDCRWSDLRHIAYDFNLCSCWSMPIRDSENKSIGTFALYSFEHRSPAPFHKKLLQSAASIVNIVLNNQVIQKRIELFSMAAQSASEGMIITDVNNNIVEVNDTFEKIYGYKEEDVLHKNPRIFASNRHNKQFYQEMWKNICEKSKWSGEITNRLSDGSEISQWMSISTVYDEKGVIQNYLAVFSDMTELKNSQKQILFMAYHDSLTKLYNKTYLEKNLELDLSYTLILLNVNNFSYINTAYGFKIGDKLLVKLAKILKSCFYADITCRINSDEFVLLFNGEIEIEEKIANIKEYFYNNLIYVKGISLSISFTFGVVYGSENLLRNSALALKQAKENGKNRYHIFNKNEDSINHSDREAFIKSNNILRLALGEDRVIPYFQGIYNNKTKKIIKYEALVRIIDNGKIILPSKFLEPAHLSGILPEITKVMIDKSFEIMADNDYSFSINISEDDLSRNYLVDYLASKALEYCIDPKRVILEILEGVSSSGKQSHMKQLNKLKRAGYSLAIDDFGAEYSNFERILDLDIDFLKIDAKYIKDIDTNTKSYEIAKAISFFAKNSNIPCIAEFVHSKEVQKVVQELGIDFSQGFYFSEPCPYPF